MDNVPVSNVLLFLQRKSSPKKSFNYIAHNLTKVTYCLFDQDHFYVRIKSHLSLFLYCVLVDYRGSELCVLFYFFPLRILGVDTYDSYLALLVGKSIFRGL